MAYVFPDNTVLCNFACTDQVGLLVDHLRGRGRWVEAVADEARRSSGYLPALGVLLSEDSPLGEAIRIDDPGEVAAVERKRRTVFGGTADKPLQHLGEAQTCHLLQTDPTWAGATWVTDDQEAYRYAQQQGILARGTVDLFRSMVADADLTAAQAHAHLLAIDAIRTGLPIPERPDDLV